MLKKVGVAIRKALTSATECHSDYICISIQIPISSLFLIGWNNWSIFRICIFIDMWIQMLMSLKQLWNSFSFISVSFHMCGRLNPWALWLNVVDVFAYKLVESKLQVKVQLVAMALGKRDCWRRILTSWTRSVRPCEHAYGQLNSLSPGDDEWVARTGGCAAELKQAELNERQLYDVVFRSSTKLHRLLKLNSVDAVFLVTNIQNFIVYMILLWRLFIELFKL